MKKNAEMNKIITLLYVIIGILVINTLVLLISNIKFTKEDSPTTSGETANEDYDVSMFNSVNSEGFLELVNKESTSVIYLGRGTCGYCVKFLPTLQKAQKEIGYKTNYVDIEKVGEDSEATNKMIEMINNMSEQYNEANGTDYESLYGYTPTVVVVGNGKIKNIWIGYSDYDTYASWLKENGVK